MFLPPLCVKRNRAQGLLMLNKGTVCPAARWQKFGALEQCDEGRGLGKKGV